MSRTVRPSALPPVVGEVLLEMKPIGRQMKVTALDPVSLTEVSFIAPSNAVRTDVKRLAISKLSYVIRKKQNLT